MDNFWTWVGAQIGNIISAAGLITGFIFYWLSRRPKRFGWEVMSNTPILSSDSGHLPLKVVYDGKDVSSPNISVIRVGNTGKMELTSADFDGPVRIGFENSEILQVLRSGRSDEGIDLKLTKDDLKSILCRPTLLNPGEWIEFQLVTDGPLEAPTVRARVAGQASPASGSQDQRTTKFQKVGMAFIFGGFLLSILPPIFLPSDLKGDVSWFGIACAFVGFVIINRAEASVWKKPARKKKRRKGSSG